jgi:hypothetical protein
MDDMPKSGHLFGCSIGAVQLRSLYGGGDGFGPVLTALGTSAERREYRPDQSTALPVVVSTKDADPNRDTPLPDRVTVAVSM